MSQETFNKSEGQDYNYLTFLKTLFIHSFIASPIPIPQNVISRESPWASSYNQRETNLTRLCNSSYLPHLLLILCVLSRQLAYSPVIN